MTIEWSSTEINPPLAGKEIIAKNESKSISVNSSAKQCKIMKFNKNFSEDHIISIMLDDDLTLWSYTE